jgi:hypothetical protein
VGLPFFFFAKVQQSHDGIAEQFPCWSLLKMISHGADDLQPAGRKPMSCVTKRIARPAKSALLGTLAIGSVRYVSPPGSLSGQLIQ